MPLPDIDDPDGITLTEEQLYELYHGRKCDIHEIAHYEDVTPAVVRYWLAEYDISKRGAHCARPPRKTLVEHFRDEGLSPKEVSYEYGVSRSVVYEWCRKYDIDHMELRGVERPTPNDDDVYRAGPDTEIDAPDRPEGFYTPDEDDPPSECTLSKDELYELYWGEGLSTREIGERDDGVAKNKVRRRMETFGIPRRSRSYNGDDRMPIWHGFRAEEADTNPDTEPTVDWQAAMD